MQLIFTPALGATTRLGVVPGTTVQFAARVSTRDYNEALANGTRVELWGDLPRGSATGDWAATCFEAAPVPPEHHDSGAPPNVLSLLPANPEPVPTTSAAPETTLLVANFTIPSDVHSADYQFTYRLAHSNESSTWYTWLGDAGSNGHLIIDQEAPAIEGLVFTANWKTDPNDAQLSPADGTVATLAGPVDWSGWALDLDPTSESPATPRRFSTLPKALNATHLALFPNPGLTTLNPASHSPIFVSTSSRLSINDRALIAQGSPIKITPLSRSAVEASLPAHALLLAESASTHPFLVVHDTRGNSLSILPIAPTTPGTQVISLDLDQANITASSPGKSLLFSPSSNKATVYTQGARVAVPVLGGDVQVCDVYALGEDGRWDVGVVGGTKIAIPEPEPEPESEYPASIAENEAPKVAPPPIETRSLMQELNVALSPETPAEARIDVAPTKQPELRAVPETLESELEHERSRAVTPRPTLPPPTFIHGENHTILGLFQNIVVVFMYYVACGAWNLFSWAFRMFGVGAHSSSPVKPADVESPAHKNTELPSMGISTPRGSLSESGSDVGSLNEITPTPIEPMHVAHVAVVDPQLGEASCSPPSPTQSPTRKPRNMPLTPPMSPKATDQFVIPGLPVEPVVSKPKLAFATPQKATLVVVSSAPDADTDELAVKVGGVRIPTAWDAYEGRTWVFDVEVGKETLEIGLA
ncbi:unnamed protein product [Rhizoctonia solani]|uniref:Uncharacterized protein n=1 Tax=Rhizoctonia solani TaxID=456999 RepID=A0A8H2XLH9_9AGAM|nr:uncharacterized protein RhiXN_01769 [Rhizoctonia solani]KAF8682455.1 hypothetical protein RHS04_02583 [Rhizoctonia solani]QRW27174.1 hypothetical protein RhiXN_01769 [Rhizoctonia solani]CAE6425972.1 unnamed protein product [Rhizoctonia solani]